VDEGPPGIPARGVEKGVLFRENHGKRASGWPGNGAGWHADNGSDDQRCGERASNPCQRV